MAPCRPQARAKIAAAASASGSVMMRRIKENFYDCELERRLLWKMGWSAAHQALPAPDGLEVHFIGLPLDRRKQHLGAKRGHCKIY